MKVILVLILVAITVASYQECCTLYVVITESSSDDTSVESCNITLTQLINLLNSTYNKSMNCFSSKKIEFQSSITATGNETFSVDRKLSFKNISRVVINGEPNATINCQELFSFEFVDVSFVEIKNIHIDNCNSLHSGISFAASMHLSVIKIVIVNSNFTNSCAALMWHYRSASIVLMIRNVIFENCCYSLRTYFKSKPILDLHPEFLQSYNDTLLDSENLNNFTFQSMIVRNNTAPFLTSSKSLKTVIKIAGHNFFIDNKVNIITYHGFSHFEFELIFSNTALYFTNNTCNNEMGAVNSPIYFAKAKVLFEHSHAVFSNNHGHTGGVISTGHGGGTKIVFSDNTTLIFCNNVGKKGGVLFLDSNSTIIFNATKSRVLMYLTENTAPKGGAIYVEESSLTTHLGRLLDYKPVEVRSVFDVLGNASLVKMTFRDNAALLGGNHIYGGWVDWSVKNGLTRYNFDTMEKILKIEGNSSSDVASDPVRICLCDKGYPNCSITDHSIEIYGYVAYLDLVAVGQRYTPVSAYVRAIFEKTKSLNIELLQQTCTTVSYIVDFDNETLILQPHYEGIDSQKTYDIICNRNSINDSSTIQALLLFHNLTVQVRVKPCPLGFALHETKHICVCQPWLEMLDLTCEPDSTKVRRKRQQWVSITFEHAAPMHKDQRVIVHQNCPFQYCRMDEESLVFNLEDRDELCALNRSGILCGGCKTNFSRMLGSSGCKVCTNNAVLLAVIIIWLLSGILLVIFLILLDFTVSTGTINGLIFYANIIHAQHSIFFTSNTHSFLSKFISWLNLDQGIELCLYDGLDTYTITWLQFLFPLYIWTITVALIVSSHYSTLVSRIIGSNAVPVLATLFLITYAKILRLIIDVISFTTITYPDGYKSVVWLIDGNVKILNGKHIPLFLVTLIFLLFSMPFTFILLTIQLLYKISHYRVMFWVNKLKPLFDAYTGPYKAKHRYWTGLLLIFRIVLLIFFSLNQTNNPTTSLVAITAASITLLIWLYFSGGVYNDWLNNYLEAFFLTNVGFTSTVMLFELSNDEYSPAAIYISTGIAFVVFTGVIIYHAQRWLIKVVRKVKELSSARRDNRISAEESVLPYALENNVELSKFNVTNTGIKLIQPLLEDDGCAK